MSYYLGKNSEKNMGGINRYLYMIAHRAIEIITSVDFGVPYDGGVRTAVRQFKIYREGNSKCDGFKKISCHQTGNAIDAVPFIDGTFNWNNKQAIIDVQNAFEEAERQLREEGKIPNDIYIHHGIYWKGWKDINDNGKLDVTDKLGWDGTHHEVRNVKQIKYRY